ncbi:TIGR03621 family F420-dependent LLM class oxidoreductase [Plantactinospora sp. CA-290183]|uniref:TIGR03621 family F420-dependent LLM class oxidoreductase n=1 Tax=Plantactinospora sp. CA-290183 TaxID=3240006 RepID=UPI003D8A1FA3
MTSRAFRFGTVVSTDPGGGNWPDLARQIAERGYQTLLMTDHVSGQLAPGPALAVAAAAAPQLRVGSLVYCNDLYSPVLLAREVSTLASLTGGRFEFGLGAGWQAVDYLRTGVEFRTAGVRVDRLAESLEVIEKCRLGEAFEHHGRHYDVEVDRRVVPAVDAAHRAPVIIGGGGPRVLRLAGRRADIVSVNPALRDPDGHSSTFYLDNDAEATDRKLRWVREGAGDRFAGIELALTVYLAMVCEDRDAVARVLARRAGVDPERLLANPHVLIGTPEQMADTLSRRRDRWAISYVMVDQWQHKMLGRVVEKLSGQ